MDIRNWPIDKIMQLPDYCFGRRWPISVSVNNLAAGVAYDISEAALPERCVIWEVIWFGSGTAAWIGEFDLRLGDQLPAAAGQFFALPVLFRDFGQVEAASRFILLSYHNNYGKLDVRVPVLSAGRRLVGRFAELSNFPGNMCATIVLSSFPTEVPDWLISG